MSTLVMPVFILFFPVVFGYERLEGSQNVKNVKSKSEMFKKSLAL